MFFKKGKDTQGLVKKIKAAKEVAETVCIISKTTYNKILDFSEKSLGLVDEIIESEKKKPRIVQSLSEPGESTLASIFGSYFGEVIIRNLGGKWVITKDIVHDNQMGNFGIDVGGNQISPYHIVRDSLKEPSKVAMVYKILKFRIKK